jgi:hypothetical protein
MTEDMSSHTHCTSSAEGGYISFVTVGRHTITWQHTAAYNENPNVCNNSVVKNYQLRTPVILVSQ